MRRTVIDRDGNFKSKVAEGYTAAKRGVPVTKNPYPAHTIFGRSWRDGHRKYELENSQGRLL